MPAVMSSLGRFLQLLALIIPPLAMVAQLSNEAISLGQMLTFLVAAVALFGIGYLLQQYTGGS